MERAVPGFPIWPCSRWGLPCPLNYSRGGGLLPHLFTLTLINRAVCFLWSYPSPFDAQELPGSLPCGARTFLSNHHGACRDRHAPPYPISSRKVKVFTASNHRRGEWRYQQRSSGGLRFSYREGSRVVVLARLWMLNRSPEKTLRLCESLSKFKSGPFDLDLITGCSIGCVHYAGEKSMRLRIKLPTVATYVEPSMRLQLDAASRGTFYSIHASSIQEVARVVREGPASTVLFSARYVQASQMPGVEDLVRSFPAVTTVAVYSSAERLEAKTLLDLGASGVRQLVDLCDRNGWNKLRSIVSEPLDTVISRVVTAIVPALGEPSRGSRAFFEALLRVAPETTTVRSLCGILGVHPSTMMSRFLRAGLPSPREYLSWVRLVHAAGLLEDRGLSLSDVAYRLDHSSPQSFGRHIKSLLGCTASQYRKSYDFQKTVDLFIERMVAPHRYALSTFEPLPTGVFPGRRR